MHIVKLTFWGYTWEQFKWRIENKKGILLVYRGYLDAEGFVKMKEIIYVDFTTVKSLYENPIIDVIKHSLAPGEMLFFSVANVDECDSSKVIRCLVNTVKPMFNQVGGSIPDLILECQGNCDLVPPIINDN